MRYLTHESEDNFWVSHGAKPHPLAKAEAERRTQINLQLQQQAAAAANLVSSLNQKAVKFLQDQEVVSRVSNGKPSTRNDGRQSFTSKDSTPAPSDDGTGSNRSSTSESSRKSYLNMTDEEVLRSQEHAQRVGYKVSSV